MQGSALTQNEPLRLAVYGSLAPGKQNHDQLASLKGSWTSGTVRGRLFPEGRGTAMGYPGLIFDPQGDVVEVNVFESLDLPSAWARLDDFEGSGYRRVLAQITQENRQTLAHIYVLTL